MDKSLQFDTDAALTKASDPAPSLSESKRIVARGYLPATDNGVPTHPQSKPAPQVRHPNRPGVATDRAVPKIDTRSGLDKAASSLKPVRPAANLGGNASIITSSNGSAGFGSGRPPQRAK